MAVNGFLCTVPATNVLCDPTVGHGGGGPTTYFQNCDGVLSFLGDLQKQTNKILDGALSFAGALQKQTNKVVDGGLSFAGVLQRMTLKLVAGGASFTGALQRQTNKLLDGALGFAGALQRQTNKLLDGGLSFNGALVAAHTFFVSVGGTLSFAGDLVEDFLGPITSAIADWLITYRRRR